MYNEQITEQARKYASPGEKNYLATWNQTRDKMYAQLARKHPDDFHNLKDVADEWNEVGTPDDVAHENRKRNGTAIINKSLEYFERRLGITGVFIAGWLNADTGRPEVGM